MRLQTIFAPIVVLGSLVSGSIYAEVGQRPGPWQQGNPAEIFARAKREGKPVLTYWSATWCQFCMVLKQELFSNAEVTKELANHYLAIHLDADDEATGAWSARYHVTSYPTILLLRDNGDIASTIHSGMTAPEFVDFLQKARTNGPDLETLRQQIVCDRQAPGDRQQGAKPCPSKTPVSLGDLGRLASQTWYEQEAPAPFVNAEEKCHFYRNLQASAKAWDEALADQCYYQYLVAVTRNGIALKPEEERSAAARLAAIISNPKSLHRVVWQLPYALPDIVKHLHQADKMAEWQHRLLTEALANDKLAAVDRVVIWRALASADPEACRQHKATILGLMDTLSGPGVSTENRTLVDKTLVQLNIDLGEYARAEKLIRSKLSDASEGPIFADLMGDRFAAQEQWHTAWTWYKRAASMEKGGLTRLIRTRNATTFFAEHPSDPQDIAPFVATMLADTADEPNFYRLVNRIRSELGRVKNSAAILAEIAKKMPRKTPMQEKIARSFSSQQDLL